MKNTVSTSPGQFAVVVGELLSDSKSLIAEAADDELGTDRWRTRREPIEGLDLDPSAGAPVSRSASRMIRTRPRPTERLLPRVASTPTTILSNASAARPMTRGGRS